MIITLKEKRDFIYAYIEFAKVDSFGNHTNLGDYIRVDNIWVHPWYRKRDARVVLDLALRVYRHPSIQECIGVFWKVERGKQTEKLIDDYYEKPTQERVSKLYTPGELIRKLKGEDKCSSDC